jgi:hypothetical protein
VLLPDAILSSDMVSNRKKTTRMTAIRCKAVV